MTFNIVPWWAYLAAGAMAGALLAGGVQQARVASVKADLAREQVIRAALQADLATASDKARAAADTARQAKADAVAAVDNQSQKELTDAKRDNDRLRTAVRISADSLRILGARCPGPADPVPAAASASGVGDAAPTLNPGVRENILDLRESIISDAAMIDYLQNYILAIRAGHK